MESSDILDYVLKVVMIHGIFFLLYFVLLRNKTSHKLNRTYLLATLLSAFFIPALEFSIPEEAISGVVETPTFHWEEELPISTSESIILNEIAIEKSPTYYWAIAKWGYILLSIGLFLRSSFHLVILQKLKYQSEYVERQWFKLFKTSQPHPFSFLSNVFIPKVIFGTNSFDQILEHECEHVRQYHSVDRLLLDFMVALFWFNPFIFLYRKALIEIHEYQADAAVLKKFPDPIEYQEVLFSQLSTASYSGLVSHFNFSTIKKRIVMINKRNNKRSIWAYALAVPVTLWVILAFSGRVDIEPLIEPVVDETLAEETLVEKPKQDTTTPSILPIENSDKMRMTSGFGMRMHPVLKVRKMHNGVDFSAPIGTGIFATANGVVAKVQSNPGGYGKMVMMAHGEKYQTRYAHLSSIEVKEGEEVKKGQRIGMSGNSGASSIPHLHYEVIEIGVGHKNPASFITNYKFAQEREKLEMLETQPEEKEQLMEEEEVKLEEAREAQEDGQRAMLVLETEEELVLEEEKEIEEIEELASLEVIEEEERVLIEEEGEMRAKMVLSNDDQRIEIAALENEVEVQKVLLKTKGKSGGVKPLFVIDGDIVGGTDDLQPDDIESVTVLKGKSAMKAYGKKGKNGVIEIKTKNKSDKKSLEKEGKKSTGVGFSDSFPALKQQSTEASKMVKGDLALAALDGEITTITYLANLGNVVMVEHANDYRTVYSRLKPVDVKIGDLLEKGDQIGVYESNAADRFQGYQGKDKVKDTKRAQSGSFRVLIDAGHGGTDDGAVSPSGKLEKDISLTIAKLVKANFANSGSIEIVLSRDKDIFLDVRERVDQSKNADLMIALHTDNYSNKNESFVVPIYNDLHVESEKSKQLANLLAQEFKKSGKEAKVGYSSGYYVLKNAKCPAVMLQVGFFSKEEEDVYLSSASGQKEVAQRISDAIELAVL